MPVRLLRRAGFFRSASLYSKSILRYMYAE